MKSHDLLIEIGTEELPSGAVKVLSEAFAQGITNHLAKMGIAYGQIRVFATPRRLAVLLHDVATSQPTQHISRKGPACDATQPEPSKALIGFAKSCGVSIDDLTQIKTDKGIWWAFESSTPGLPTQDVLVSIVNDTLSHLPIAKPMRWGNNDYEFSRPVHWVMMVFGETVIEGEVFGVQTGHVTHGHRFHHPEALLIPVPCLYESMLFDANVVADFARRRQLIEQQVMSIAKANDLEAIIPDALLDEVTSIVEWPKALLIPFDPIFLTVPAEALIAAMQSHQKCFALRDKGGKLSPYFITVSNIESTNPASVIEGNEKVMRARLSDAAFFYQQDQKKPLSSYIPNTESVVFQTKLGSLADKTRRMAGLIELFIQPFGLKNEDASRSVALSKCDLLTGMVGEFPELQGLMGRYYATHDKESPLVAVALEEQYQPKFATDTLPSSPLGTALSLVDRLDTLVGLFGIGQKPSGVKDPFKLRRHALAIVRMLIQNPVMLNCTTMIENAYQQYTTALTVSKDILTKELKAFLLERMQSHYQTQGLPSEMIFAVRACQDEWLFDMDKRIKALQKFITLPEAFALSAASKRVSNLLSQTTAQGTSQKVQVRLLQEPAERALYDHIKHVEKIVSPYYTAGEYTLILTELATLKAPVDSFFENVMVLTDDAAIKQNRIHLLQRLQALLQGVADIAELTSLMVAKKPNCLTSS